MKSTYTLLSRVLVFPRPGILKNVWTILCFLLALLPLRAQEFFEVPTKYNCTYTGVLEEELYSFESTPPVPGIVHQILLATGSERNFELVQCNVESVAAILSNGKRYLLYSQDFYLKLPQNERAVAYGLLAHEIGHHVNEHTFDPAFREKEELEADFFMGYALSKVEGIAQRHAAIDIPRKQSYAYQTDQGARRLAIHNGWERSNQHVQVQENMAYESGANATDIHLPYFPWPPPQLFQRHTLSEQLYKNARSLGDVNTKLRQALQANGYEQRSYFQVPNGFAIVTQLEQFKPDGSPKSGANRWKDYPVQENFEGVWDYLKSLVMSTPGNFRIFVFVVTDQPYGQSSRRVAKQEAVAWLSNGLNRLPPKIAEMPINNEHYLDVLVYEFEAPPSTKLCQQKWPAVLNAQTHLQKAGISKSLGF
ncbi:MAG: hypothetical protein IPH31_15445 [Lewinellaceae bacterium]|nr:hypothetical protein [Lewinellaceae bacterium]